MGRVLQERRTIGAVAGDYENDAFNLNGSVASVTSLGYGVSYTYDRAARPLTATYYSTNTKFVSGATYAPPGELAGMTMGSATGFAGITVANAYNNRLQPILLSAASPSGTVFSESFDFHLGAGDNGNVYQIVNNRDNTRNQNFIYDSLNRIQQAYSSGTQWGETFGPTATSPGVAPATSGIDAWGNLTNRSGVTGKTYTEPLSASAGTNNRLSGFGYDSAGNMTSNGSASYVYDAENRLIWTNSNSGYRYLYDGDGQRVEKCLAATSTTACPTSGTNNGTLYWRGLGSDPLSETDLAGNVQNTYIFFNGQRVARSDSAGAIHYYFSDHLGSHGVVENATGSVCEQDIDYYPYGGQENDYCLSAPQHYKFTGKERDSESGLDYFGARYNASSLGRFMTPDPKGGHIEDPQTLNRYAYVANNPLNRTDPTGLDWYLGCTTSDHSGCTQLNDKDKTWVQAGKNGNATIVTSDSIRNGDNSATVDQNGVHITTGGNTYQGVYYDNPASKTYDSSGKVVDDRNPLTVQGDASKGFGGFTFALNGNCGNTCLASGSFQFAGTPEQARAALKAAGGWDYGVWDLFDSSNLPIVGHHPDTDQFRFGSGPSPHFSVPYDFLAFGKWVVQNPRSTVPATGDFHVDATTGTSHGLCANLGVGCSK